MTLRVTQLSGGVGGARMARGFDGLPDVDLTVIVNVGDDLPYRGLAVSPDLDTVVYTLAGVEGPQGWGRDGDTFTNHQEMSRFWPSDDFMVGDIDLALKIFRTETMASGATLTEVTAQVATAFGVRSTILPVSDDPIRTVITTAEGESLDFREYFVTRRHRDQVGSVVFDGAGESRPGPDVIKAVESADIVVIGPSNPPLSIWPILAVPGVRAAVESHPRVVGVSPLIGGAAVKGPAASVIADLDLGSGIEGVARCYEGLIDLLVVDPGDVIDIQWDPRVRVVGADISIPQATPARRLASAILEL
jgi:LPPG:FO 2-phospho-L-lactate transferase